MKKLFIVLVGNIASGKSTLCKDLVKEGFIICSRDSLRYMIGAGEYRFDANLEGSIAEAHDHMLAAFLDKEHDIVVDEVNVQSARRIALNELADEFEYTKVALVLPILTKKASVDRRMKKEHGKFGRKIWEGVWEKFNKLYTTPSEDEGFDYVLLMDKGDAKEVKKIIKDLKTIKNKKEKPSFKETEPISKEAKTPWHGSGRK